MRMLFQTVVLEDGFSRTQIKHYLEIKKSTQKRQDME